MRFDRFDLNLLVILDTLLEERNVTKASERLHIGQSGASAALKRLREHFGDELLVPVGRQMTLTPLAQTLVEPVREALLQVRAALARKPAFDPTTENRKFVLCASDYVTTALMAEVIRHIAEQAPQASIEVRRPPKNFAEVFDRGELDLIVMPEPYLASFTHPKVSLFQDTHVCLVWTGHASVGDSITLEQYMDLGHVAVRLGDDARAVMFEEWFQPRYGRQRRIECSVDNFSTLALLVVGTQRVATLHRRLAEYAVRHLPLRMLALPLDVPPLVETMAWPRHMQNDPAHAWLREQVQAVAARLDDPDALSRLSKG
jgi:LysR family transcriptional regulator, nod-box dependent transcriptional activator